jgi:hypothetical protein
MFGIKVVGEDQVLGWKCVKGDHKHLTVDIWDDSLDIIVREDIDRVDNLLEQVIPGLAQYKLIVFKLTPDQEQQLIINKLKGH